MSASLGPHSYTDFDEMLAKAREHLGLMGTRVELQLEDTIVCLRSGSRALIDQVLRHEGAINELERSIDALAGQIIVRQQPAAGDLRLLIALLKATTDLERIGDESKKIALCARNVFSARWPMRPPYIEIHHMARGAQAQVRRAVQALKRLEAAGAVEIARRDAELNEALRSVLRQLISCMIEDPRTISLGLDVLFVAKSLERIGDHAKNLSEHVVYAVSGEDVRHVTPDELAAAAKRAL